MKKFVTSALILLSTFPLLSQTTSKVSQHSHQHDTNQSTEVFDEQQAYAEAAKKGIPPAEQRGYVEGYLKPQFYQKQNQTFNYANRQYSFDNGTMRVNLTPPQTNNANCPNAEFEQLDFTNWTSNTGTIGSGGVASWGGPGTYGPTNSVPNSSWSADIMTTPPGNNNPGLGPVVGYDPIAINPTTGLADIPLVAPTGGISSVRIGNEQTGAITERLIYSMAVTPANAQFTYQYAVVLQDPNHLAGEQPFFKVIMKDGAGVPLTGCGQYQVDASQAASDPSFIHIQYNFDDLYYKPWNVVSVDLSGYIGQTITIEFQTADCIWSGHFGYAYIDASCGIIQGYVNGYCAGSTQVLLTAPTGFTQYQWSGPNSYTPIPGGTDDSLIITNPNLNDTFFVQMVNAAGCTTVVMTIITPSELGIQNMSSTATCPMGASGTANVIPYGGLITGYNFVWSSGQGGTGTIYDTTQTAYNLPQDTIWVHITSGNCPPKDSFIVVNSIAPPPALVNKPICNLGVLLTTSSPSYNIQWYDQFGGAISGANNDSLFLSSASGGQIYSVGYNDSTSGCRDSMRFTLNAVTFNLNGTGTSACPGGLNGNATMSVTSGFAPYSYSFTGPNSYSSSQVTNATTYVLNNLASGTYTAVVSTNTCVDTVTFTVGVTNFVSNPSSMISCYGGNTGSITLTGTAPSAAPYVYSAVGPVTQTNNSNLANNTFNNLPAGTYTVSVTGSGGNCVYDTVITVAENQPPVTASNDSICPNDTTVLSSPNSGTHQWYTPAGVLISGATTQSFTASPAVFGTYTDSSATAQGCIEIHNLTLTEVAFNSSVASIDNNPCYQDSVGEISMQSSGGLSPSVVYYWTGPNNFSATGNSQTNLLSGVYIIVSKNGNCIDTTLATIVEPGPPNDTLIIETSFCDGDTSAVLSAPQGFTNYQWSYNGTEIPGATNDSIFILNPASTYGNYSVSYFVATCKRKTTVVFRSIPPALFTPDVTTNIFTPNGDGRNDYFHPYYNMLIDAMTGGKLQQYINYASDDYSMKIYNRWGILVFESSDYSIQWNGKNMNGKEADEGTYFWMATYKSRCGNGEYTNQTGYVQLLRSK